MQRLVPFSGNPRRSLSRELALRRKTTALGNECPLCHASKCLPLCEAQKAQARARAPAHRRIREVQTIKSDKSVWGSPTGRLTDLLEGHPEERALEEAKPLEE